MSHEHLLRYTDLAAVIQMARARGCQGCGKRACIDQGFGASLRAATKWRMNLTNDSYTILISTKNWTERYYRDKAGWVKKSTRGRKFRATAEQVLNHLLPALAGVKAGLIVKVEHHAPRCPDERGQ